MRRSGIRDISFALGAQVATIIAALGTQMLLARLLGPEGRGAYAACIVFSTMLMTFCTFGRLSGAGYLLASGKLNLSLTVSNALVYGGIGSVVAMVIGYSLMQLPIQFFDRAPRVAFLLSLLRIGPHLLSLGLMAILGAYRDFFGVAVFAVFAGLLQISCTVVFVVFLKWGVFGCVAAMTLAAIVNVMANLGYLRLRHGLSMSTPSFGALRRMFGYGIRTYFGHISQQTNMQIGTLILAASPAVSQEDLGIYAAVVTLCVRLQFIPNALSQVLMPRVAGDAEGRRELIAQCARIMFVLMGLIGVLLVVLAGPVVLLAFGSEFLTGVDVLRIVVPGILLRSVAKMYIPYLRGTDRPGITSVASLTALVLDVGLLVLLLPVLGRWGAAIAVTVSWAMEAVVLFVGFRHFSGLRLREMVRFRRSDWRPLVSKLRKRGLPAPAPPEANAEWQAKDD